MARRSAGNIPLSSMDPKYLHTNSTSHTWAFGAFAELIDNAYDPDVNAQHVWIDWTQIKDKECLIFMDDGAGLDYNKMLKMLSFGYSEKKKIRGHAPVGQYGNGFKSGSMRIGKDAIVFSKAQDTMTVGLLSQTYLAAIQAQNIVVPIITVKQDGEDKISVESDDRDSLEAILKHSPFTTEKELLWELQAINSMSTMVSTRTGTGTRIIIWNLRCSKDGHSELDLKTDRYDIRIPRVDSGEENNHQEASKNSEPESQYSLRAYCSILYLKPRIQIIIRGRLVQTQLVKKSLSCTRRDRYTPQFLKKHIPITFGYGTKGMGDGMMIYYKNRLIRAYERVGCQRKAVPKGVGIIGIIQCDFLAPMHNKQDFDYTDEYRKVKQKLGEKLEEYWNQMHHLKQKRNPRSTLPIEDMEAPLNWVQCSTCLKWRKLPDGIDKNKLPELWMCAMNPDPQYRTCQAEEELEDSADEQPYEKTYKLEKRRLQENRQQDAEGDIPTPSTSTTPSTRSGTTAGGNVTNFTPPTSTPLNTSGSGHLLSAQSTPRSSSTPSTAKHPRSKRELSWTPEGEQVKRARVQRRDIDFSSIVEETGAQVAPCVLSIMKPSLRASEGGVNPQLSDGVLADESMETNTAATATFAPSAVHPMVSVETQTGGVAKVEKEEWPGSLREGVQLLEREPRELIDSCGVMPPLLETACEEVVPYKERVEIANRERDQYKEQVERANQERDMYRGQMDIAYKERDQYKDQVETANQERDQHKKQMERANQERDQYREQMERANQEREQHKKQMERANQEYREQMERANQEREQHKKQMERANQEYREQMERANQEREQHKKQMERANQEREQYREQMERANQEYREQMERANQEYREQMERANQERDQHKKQMERANQERDQHMAEVNKLMQNIRTISVKQEQCDQALGGVDDLDPILIDLGQLKSKVESLEAEKAAGFSRCEWLKTELECHKKELDDLKEAGSSAPSHSCAENTGNCPNSGSTEAVRLRNLRVSVSRLLVILVPELELDQVNYDSDVIEEILEQYIDGVSYSEAT